MGIIKKILGRELNGWADNPSMEVYPITHVGAVYDSSGASLESIISKMQEDIINGTGGDGGTVSAYPVIYLWAYIAAESDSAASAALNKSQQADTPSNYSATPVSPGNHQNLYMTTARKRNNTYLYWTNASVADIWSTPVRIGSDGSTSGTGTDGEGYNYVYCLTAEPTAPAIPQGMTVAAIESLQEYNETYGTNKGIKAVASSSPVQVDTIQDAWRDHPNGVRPEYPCEWILVSKSEDGVWGPWQGPTMWSYYGKDGKDGDTVEYVYRLTAEGTESVSLTEPYTGRVGENGTPTYSNVSVGDEIYQNDDFIPDTWHDNPLSLTNDLTKQWVSVRKKEWDSTQNKAVWKPFSAPTLWSRNSVTRTVVDAPYTITNDNIMMAVPCSYDGTPLENGSYGTAKITILKGSQNVTDDFSFSSGISVSPASGITPGYVKDTTNHCVTISPTSIGNDVDKATITVTGTHSLDNTSLSTTVTVMKIKAAQPGTVPTVYEIKLSQDVAFLNDSTVSGSIQVKIIKTDGTGRSILTTFGELGSDDLVVKVAAPGVTEENATTLTGSSSDTISITASTYFPNKVVGTNATVYLYYDGTLYDMEDFTLISLGGGDTTIINEDYMFMLESNNEVIKLEGFTNNIPSFAGVDSNGKLKYKILGYYQGVPMSPSTLKKHFDAVNFNSSNNGLTVLPNAQAADVKLIQDANGVYVEFTPKSSTSGASTGIVCYRNDTTDGESAPDIWGRIEARYLLETASYHISLKADQLQLTALSSTVADLSTTVESHSATITHNSRQLNSTIESQYVFSNLFGFSNGLTFYQSEPFIQGYGLEVKTKQDVNGNYASGVWNLNLDTTKDVVVSMDVFKNTASNVDYLFGVMLNGNYCSRIEYNDNTADIASSSTKEISLQGGVTYKVRCYFKDISTIPSGHESFANALSFHVDDTSGNTQRLFIQNLKVEYGLVPTAFCISDEDAKNYSPENILTEAMSPASTTRSTDTPYDYSSATMEGHTDVHCFSGISLEPLSGTTTRHSWLLQYPSSFTQEIGKVYTLTFLAKASAANTHIESIMYVGGTSAQLGDYTYEDYTNLIMNGGQGQTIHTVGTEWKKFYARFYVSTSFVGEYILPVIRAVAYNNYPTADFNSGGTDQRSVYITDVQLYKAYVPADSQKISDDAYQKSMINQTSSDITLQVENRMKKSGITLTADGVTINATKVAFTGNNGIEYITMGQYDNGVPYFIFKDPSGNPVYDLGYQGLRHLIDTSRSASMTSYTKKMFTGDFDGTVPASVMFDILSTNNNPAGYTNSVTYYQFSAAVLNGNMSEAGGAVDGFYYQTDSMTNTGSEDLPSQNNDLFAVSDIWWAVIDRQAVSANEAFGQFVIFHNGIYKQVGFLKVYKNNNNTYIYSVAETDDLAERVSADLQTLDLNIPERDFYKE